MHVFSYDDEKELVYLERESSVKDNIINLFLHEKNFIVVKDLWKLLGSQLSKDGHKKYICLRCINAFGTEKLLEEHMELSQNHDHQRHVYPKEGSKCFFKQYHKLHRVSFVVYADFECFVKQMYRKIGKKIVQYQTEHIPSGFCYIIKCMDESIYPGKTVLYTMEKEGEDIGKRFVESLEEELKDVYEILTTEKPIIMAEKDRKILKKLKSVIFVKICSQRKIIKLKIIVT